MSLRAGLRVLYRTTMMNLMMTLEYRASFFASMVNTVIGPVTYLLVWLAVAEQGITLPYSRSQFVTYYLWLSLISMLTSCWLSGFLAESIRLGKLSARLLRPSPYILHYAGNNLGEKLVKLPLLLPSLAVTLIAFRGDLRLPTDPRLLAIFAAALPLAAIVAFLLDVVLASLAFWIHDVGGLLRLKELAAAFLSGRLVPLVFLPASLAPLMIVQPFRYTLSFPLELLTGELGWTSAWHGLMWQIAWCLVLWAVYRLQWRYGLRAYSAAGI